MAHLWVRETSGDWAAALLRNNAMALTGDAESPLKVRSDAAVLGAPIVLLSCPGAEKETWVLIATTVVRVCVNGRPLLTGLRALRDRDEIRVDGSEPVFFSSERLAHVEPYPGGSASAHCPRCKLELIRDSPAVKCPSCAVWYHQDPDPPRELPCWLYSPTCPMCSQSTDLESGFRWTPEGI